MVQKIISEFNRFHCDTERKHNRAGRHKAIFKFETGTLIVFREARESARLFHLQQLPDGLRVEFRRFCRGTTRKHQGGTTDEKRQSDFHWH